MSDASPLLILPQEDKLCPVTGYRGCQIRSVSETDFGMRSLFRLVETIEGTYFDPNHLFESIKRLDAQASDTEISRATPALFGYPDKRTKMDAQGGAL